MMSLKSLCTDRPAQHKVKGPQRQKASLSKGQRMQPCVLCSEDAALQVNSMDSCILPCRTPAFGRVTNGNTSIATSVCGLFKAILSRLCSLKGKGACSYIKLAPIIRGKSEPDHQ